jgi:phosphoribosyl 1,2-cyclic phosphate phosphodiesterase
VRPTETITAAGLRVRLFEQDHGFISTLGLRIGGFGYSTDVVALDEAAFATLDGVDIWVVDCFLRQGPHKTHADLPTVLAWSERIRARRTVLTHMGPDMDWAWLKGKLPPGIEPGYDGMAFDLT